MSCSFERAYTVVDGVDPPVESVVVAHVSLVPEAGQSERIA